MKADNLAAGTLAERLRSGPLERSELERLAVDLLEMLSSLHTAGKLHADLNPETVHLDRDGRLHSSKVGAQRGGSRADGASGSPRYRAPELAGGQPSDVGADLFACGVLLSECAGPDAPAPVLVLIGMLTAAEPDLRPASAAEALALLGAPAPGTPVAAVPQVPAARPAPEPLAAERSAAVPAAAPSPAPAPENVPTEAIAFPPVLNFPPAEPFRAFEPSPAPMAVPWPDPSTLDAATLDAPLLDAAIPLGGVPVVHHPVGYAPSDHYRRRPSRRIVLAAAGTVLVLGAAVGIGVAATSGGGNDPTVPPPAAGAPLQAHLDGLDSAIDGLTH